MSLLSQHLGPSICDILTACHALTGCDYRNQFYGRSKYGSFKIMRRKKEMINKLSFLSTRNIDFDCVIKFILRVINNRPRTEATPEDLRYAMLFVKKKGKKRKFSDTNRLPNENQETILRNSRYFKFSSIPSYFSFKLNAYQFIAQFGT